MNNTGNDCYFKEESDSFLIFCDNSTDPPTPYMSGRSSNFQILNISIENNQMSVTTFVAKDCYTSSGVSSQKNDPSLTLAIFPISPAKNMFIAVGCDTYATFRGRQGSTYTTGCLSSCDSISDVINGSCSGIGCYETSIPRDAHRYNISVTSYNNHSGIWGFNPCSYAFVAEDGFFSFSTGDLYKLPFDVVPIVLDWLIPNETCDDAKKNTTTYMCKENTNCTDAENGNGYQCNCLEGFQGNLYLRNGCQDINECVISQPCIGLCTNLLGTYNCSCPEGLQGDGRKDGKGCTPIIHEKSFHSINVVLGVSISFLLIFLGISWLYWGLRERKISRQREKFFLENGGRLMLQRLLSEHEGSIESARIFTDEELKQATDHYHESRILGQGGQGTVYRGILPNNMVVAIKKAKILDRSQVEEFINELIILSQINHRNVVKLIGCCFETEVPLLVYEFVTNGTLSDHIHKCGHESTLSWRARLRIAGETAGALSYLHSDASAQILHRDIKSTNILLDENYTAKVADFGASRLVPLDRTQLTTLVQGTLGYLDPEYFHSSQLTVKSDVYSFGVVLAELLTGLRALSFERAESERNLSLYFASAIKAERLFEIIHLRVLNEGNPEEIKEVAMLASRCLRVKGEDRPTMKEVAMELEGLMRVMDRHPWVNQSCDLEEAEQLLGERSRKCDGILKSNASGNDDSISNQVPFEIESGR
ncbi:hypothetical protein BT93_L1831 [Corymbia citriodora subsp. variegata]|uniref:Protein kinase domain-containing protein n=1 Tax=Corymbia citriodora subsp. variegata TaxID=360336 RepID=A0A8T0CLX5_CORYI|nr:hypothetical protein BT93_L1831 [Corymbia citriodora subsp. variegata]